MILRAVSLELGCEILALGDQALRQFFVLFFSKLESLFIAEDHVVLLAEDLCDDVVLVLSEFVD